MLYNMDLVCRLTHYVCRLCLKGRRSHNAANPLDAARKHHVQKVHHRERRLESGGGSVGDLHLRKTAVVPALQ